MKHALYPDLNNGRRHVVRYTGRISPLLISIRCPCLQVCYNIVIILYFWLLYILPVSMSSQYCIVVVHKTFRTPKIKTERILALTNGPSSNNVFMHCDPRRTGLRYQKMIKCSCCSEFLVLVDVYIRRGPTYTNISDPTVFSYSAITDIDDLEGKRPISKRKSY